MERTCCSARTSTSSAIRSPAGTSNVFSEDPLLSGVLGAAFVRGLQGEGVGARVKHFVANEQERQRSTVNSNIDERTLREIYLMPFEISCARRSRGR